MPPAAEEGAGGSCSLAIVPDVYRQPDMEALESHKNAPCPEGKAGGWLLWQAWTWRT